MSANDYEVTYYTSFPSGGEQAHTSKHGSRESAERAARKAWANRDCERVEVRHFDAKDAAWKAGYGKSDIGTAHRKLDSLTHIRAQLFGHPEGYPISDLVDETGLHIATVSRQLEELGAQRLSRGVYTLAPTLEDIELARIVLKRIGEL